MQAIRNAWNSFTSALGPIGYLLTVTLCLIVGAGGFIGWWRNIWFLLTTSPEWFSLVRLLGVPLFPIGMITGWF